MLLRARGLGRWAVVEIKALCSGRAPDPEVAFGLPGPAAGVWIGSPPNTDDGADEHKGIARSGPQA